MTSIKEKVEDALEFAVGLALAGVLDAIVIATDVAEKGID